MAQRVFDVVLAMVPGLMQHCIEATFCENMFFRVLDEVQHKPGCITTDGQKLQMLCLGIRGLALYMLEKKRHR